MTEMKAFTSEMHIYDPEDVECQSDNRIKRELSRRRVMANMRLGIDELIERESIDVILFHGARLLPLISGYRLPLVIDFCDTNSERLLVQARYSSIQNAAKCYARYVFKRYREFKLLRKSPHVAFISKRDKAAVTSRDPRHLIANNGVDLDFWSPSSGVAQNNTIVFTGVMNYQPNEDAAFFLIDRIMPIMRARVEKPRLLLVGHSPTESLKNAAKEQDDITLTGTVDDVRPWLSRAALFVAPIRFASGMQNKVMEAMAMNLPVVTTSIVAKGIKTTDPGEPPVIVADDENDFAEEIIQLLHHRVDAADLGAKGRSYIEKNFSWKESAIKFEKMCVDAVAGENIANPQLDI